MALVGVGAVLGVVDEDDPGSLDVDVVLERNAEWRARALAAELVDEVLALVDGANPHLRVEPWLPPVSADTADRLTELRQAAAESRRIRLLAADLDSWAYQAGWGR